MIGRSPLLVGVLLGALLTSASPSAGADIEPLRLASANAREQADEGSIPALSADGRYVVFRGAIGGQRGVLRRDLVTGEIAPVAIGPTSAAPGDADRPSISADGRWVSFVTAARLDPAHDPNAVRDVYVRDMGLPLPAGGQCGSGSACAFTLASARDGADDALAGGALAAARSALSGDGRRVVFVTLGSSDLTSGPGGSTPGVPTPAGQVAVRDLDARRTTLVSVRRDRAGGATTAEPVPGGAVQTTGTTGAMSGAGADAALSADGTTVSWMGVHVPDQAPVLRDEEAAMDTIDRGAAVGYGEPLWRRIADGPQAPTRRVVGGGDPPAPGCPRDGTLSTPTCQGPFLDLLSPEGDNGPGGWLISPSGYDSTPRLSADGRSVALLGSPTSVANAFVVDMHDGLTRRQAVRQLTREVTVATRGQIPPPGLDNRQLNAAVTDIGISPDGRRLALATARQQFPLTPPSLVGGAAPRLGMQELYRVDLDRAAVERITAAPDGDASLAGGGALPGGADPVSSPTFSADGHELAFASLAANLVPGDANGTSDVFVATDRSFVVTPPSFDVTPVPAGPVFVARWTMAVRARTMRDGTVHVDGSLPGAGTLRATTKATVAVRVRTRVVRRVRVHGRVVRRTRVVTKTVLRRRTVATARQAVSRSGLTMLVLRLSPAYRALAKAKAGLEGDLSVRFTSTAQPALSDALDVRFRLRATGTSSTSVKAKASR